MYTVNFGSVSKRRNSTYVPAAAELPLSLDVALKEPTSDTAPVFLLHKQDNIFNYNYCEWSGWYYWITDVKRVRNELFEVSCRLDPLATYKTNILATTAFVMYDTTANTEIVDKRLTANTAAVYRVTYGSTFNLFTAGDTVAVGVVGAERAGIFLLSRSQADDLMGNIDNWLDGGANPYLPIPPINIFQNLDEAIYTMCHNITIGIRLLTSTGKAPDSIKSAYLLPIAASKFQTSNQRIFLGDYDTNIDAPQVLYTMLAQESIQMAIPWGFTDWRRNAPYTEIYLSLPYSGIIQLSPSDLIGVTSLDVECKVSVNGSVNYNIGVAGGGEYRRIARCGGNCASNYLIGASNNNPLGVAGAIGSAMGSTLGGIMGGMALGGPAGAVAGGVGGAASGILGVVDHIQGSPVSAGAAGGGAFTDNEIPYLITVSHDTNVAPDSVSASIGTPTMAQKTLGSLTGFVQTRGVSVSAPAERGVLDEINAALDGGVFIE